MKLLEWPELPEMTREQLLELIEKIREELLYTEDARETML